MGVARGDDGIGEQRVADDMLFQSVSLRTSVLTLS